jgi:hypothetical protein
MHLSAFVLLVSTAGALTGCSRGRIPLGTLDRTVGRASERDIMVEIPAVLRRYGYAIYNDRPTSSTLYLETGWQERAPFEDEEKAGVDYARTRFIVRARQAGPSTYTLRVSAENQVRAPADTASGIVPAWSTMAPTDLYRAYIREITGEIEMKVNAGLRKYDR